MKLEVQDLHVKVEGKEILKGVSLVINLGEVHALMGPNGSGKSTLANVFMGHPKYEVTKGKILLDGEDITSLKANERAKKGLFLSFQYPLEIPGVTVENFLRTAYNSVHGTSMSVVDFHKKMKEEMEALAIDSSFGRRYLNEGFSGGEKKRMEILQMIVLNQKFLVLDETDSGLDVDALRIVSAGINRMRGKEHGMLIITHFNRILNYVEPDHVHVLVDGKIVKSGGMELAHAVEIRGYEEHK
jgi:Fe-S cluster assembly ATP-binding protein